MTPKDYTTRYCSRDKKRRERDEPNNDGDCYGGIELWIGKNCARRERMSSDVVGLWLRGGGGGGYDLESDL